uniref:FecR family protein n=1 Tax=Pedobacter schmidteae TaxID=2201271 RepID=UPI000EACA305|nr:FecR family protein [Pedobacter schmidteae]
MKNTAELNILFQKYLIQNCSPEEVKQLLDYFGTAQADQEWLELAIEKILDEQLDDAAELAIQEKLDIGFQQILTKRNEAAKKQVSQLRLQYTKWAIAASLFLVVGMALFHFIKSPEKNIQLVHHSELKPGADRARLTLADGTVIDLEQAANGKLSNKEGTTVTKTADGRLVYDTKTGKNENDRVAYHTLVTPRGGQYKIILPDGSAAWLNAASSLRFPTYFAGKERRVELRGEGYFEVKKNATQPFVVTASGQEVTVLGTHFNINAYQESNTIKTTLLEGAVRISKGNSNCLLAPGEAAYLNNGNNKIAILKNVDTDAAIAWKDGRFSFDETNIKDAMQQIARWYDVDIVYDGDFSNVELTGVISRGTNAEQVLKLFKGMHQIDYIIKGRSITIIPYKRP